MSRPDVAPRRGAPENRTPTRFNRLPVREATGLADDVRTLDGGLPPLRTTVTVEKPRTILPGTARPT
jgi:hypothetical protein